MEFIIKEIKPYGHKTFGCQRHQRDVLLAFTSERETTRDAVHDIFLTHEQATKLLDNLQEVLVQNEADRAYYKLPLEED